MKLNLNRPIAFIDLETTGVDVAKDRIVEIAILKVAPDGSSDMKLQRINPGMPIPKESSEIHGIYDDDVKDSPKFEDVADLLSKLLNDCDLGGYNSNKFDVPLLLEEFYRAEVELDMTDKKLVDVQNIFHKMEQRTLVAAYQFYCKKDLTNAHSADADIQATYEVLLSQLEKYGELENDIDFLHEFSKRSNFVDFAGRFVYNEEGKETFNFGKHKGKLVEKVIIQEDPSYYSWMMKGEFPAYTKMKLKEIKTRAQAVSN
ncbi:MAG: 3'-5' exonuclease [Bacteroidia bacterium]|nr:3'-5' exonuclease [Bacteroidia bacterium]